MVEINPFNLVVQAHAAKLRQKVQKVDLYEAKGAQLKTRLSWLKVVDRVFKEFFKRLCPPVHTTQFQVLQVNGQRIIDLPNITKAFVAHY